MKEKLIEIKIKLIEALAGHDFAEIEACIDDLDTIISNLEPKETKEKEEIKISNYHSNEPKDNF